MQRNRVNLNLTFSAALAGLLLSLAPSAAYGHGNNPKTTSDTAPDPGGGGGGHGPRPTDPHPSGDHDETTTLGSTALFGPSDVVSLGPALFDAISTSPEVIVFVGVDATLSNVLDMSSQVLFDPATVGMDFLAADPVAPPITIDAGIVPGSGSVGGVAPNVIPAPGTLALLVLAAAAARRRRRRT